MDYCHCATVEISLYFCHLVYTQAWNFPRLVVVCSISKLASVICHLFDYSKSSTNPEIWTDDSFLLGHSFRS